MKKFLRTYLPFTSNCIKRALAYDATVFLWIFCTMFSTFISYFLWMAIYRNSESSTIGGLNLGEMIVYIFMSYMVSSLVMIDISTNINEDVVKGNVAMNLIKPIEYRTSLIFTAMGDVVFRFAALNVFIWIGVEIYRVFGLGLPVTPVYNILFFILSTIMSFLIFVLFEFCFGMIAFFTTYIFGLQLAKSAVLSFLTGQMIPLSLFPEVIQRVFDYLPFSSMVYTPVMIYLGKYSTSEIGFVLARQLIWIVILYVLGSLIWKKVTKRLVVLGG